MAAPRKHSAGWPGSRCAVSPATSKRRLMALAKLLRGLPRRRFYYACWVGLNWEGKANLSCGTSACALGWATTMPALRREGLRLVRSSRGGIVRLGSREGIHAGARAFGISAREATFLFIPGQLMDGQWAPWSGATNKEVAKHIESFVKAKWPEAQP